MVPGGSAMGFTVGRPVTRSLGRCGLSGSLGRCRFCLVPGLTSLTLEPWSISCHWDKDLLQDP